VHERGCFFVIGFLKPSVLALCLLFSLCVSSGAIKEERVSEQERERDFYCVIGIQLLFVSFLSGLFFSVSNCLSFSKLFHIRFDLFPSVLFKTLSVAHSLNS
jgi:hypothetical protein